MKRQTRSWGVVVVMAVAASLVVGWSGFAAGAGKDAGGQQAKAKARAKKPALLDPTFKDVAYGPHKRQRLNFWQAKSEKPTAVLVQIHGGGWLGGRKSEKASPRVLAGGVSYCSINYRLATTDVLPASVMDAARAIQFLRTKAGEWRIDARRIVVQGGSAGGASSLWLAYHDDLADPNSPDPVLRESSRVAGAIAMGGQTTLDPFVIRKRIGIAGARHPMIWRTVGAKSLADLEANWAKHKALSLACSPVTHVTKDDPPVYVRYGVETKVPVVKGDGIHHPGFGRILKARCDEVGVECFLEIRGGERPKITSSQFLQRIVSK